MVYGNLSNYICLHGVFSLTTQYSFLCSMSFFIACVLKPLNSAQTVRLKAVDFWKVEMNKQKLPQSSLKQHIYFQTRTNKKVVEKTCFNLLHFLAVCQSYFFCMSIVCLGFFFLTCYCIFHLPSVFVSCTSFKFLSWGSFHPEVFFEKMSPSEFSSDWVHQCPVEVEIGHPAQWAGLTRTEPFLIWFLYYPT